MNLDYNNTSIYHPSRDFKHNFDDPGKPFLLALGSSHTYGQNENHYLIKNYVDHIGDHLNLEVVKLGYPGCDNYELQMIFIDLLKSGIIHSPNLKFFIFEPRLHETTGHIPVENFLKYNTDNYSLWEDNIRDEQEISKWLSPKYMFNYYNNLTYYIAQPVGYKLDSKGIHKLIENRFSCWQQIHPRNPNKRVVVQVDTKEAEKTFLDFQATNIHIWETYYSLTKTIGLLSLVMGCVPINTKKAWWVYNWFDGNHQKFLKYRYPELHKNMIIHSVLNLMQNTYTDNWEDLYAPCKHLTHDGNIKFFNLIKENVERIYYDKET